MTGKKKAVVFVALALLLVLGAAAVSADDFTLWKQHCPAYADVVLEPAKDWGGVHVLCIRGADREEVGTDNNR